MHFSCFLKHPTTCLKAEEIREFSERFSELFSGRRWSSAFWLCSTDSGFVSLLSVFRVCLLPLKTFPYRSSVNSQFSVSLYVSRTKLRHARPLALKKKKKTASIRNKSSISKIHATVQTDSTSDKRNNITGQESSNHVGYNTSSIKLVLTLCNPRLQWRKGGWSSNLLPTEEENTP